MKMISPRHYALSVSAAAAMLAGCGGSTQPSYQLPVTSQITRAQKCQGQRDFRYIGHEAHFKVPQCAATIYVDAKGASGAYGGDGGKVSGTIPVTPGETLIVRVGGAGQNFKGGFNGGAAGAVQALRGHPRRITGAGGGGASDVRKGGRTLAHRVIVAGGGGGQDQNAGVGFAGTGGTGGGLPDGGSGGTPGCSTTFLARGASTSDPFPGGGGGTQTSGGTGGAGSNAGSLGNGGIGVGYCVAIEEIGSHFLTSTYLSTGGGGGYYGGGGGGTGGAGGGGSGYAEPAATNVSSQNGVNSGNGSVLICWGYTNGCGSH